MGVDTFKKYLEESAKAKAKGAAIDWNKTRVEWLAELEKFYAEVKGYLAPFAGRVTIGEKTIPLNEEQLGQYEAKELTVTIDDQAVRLVPIGAVLIAAKGRVDMIGPKGTVKFVLVNEHAKTPGFGISITVGDEKFGEPAPKTTQPAKMAWRYSTPPPRIKYEPITADRFLDLLLAVINGT